MTVDVFWIVDAETRSVGETTRFRVRVRTDGSTAVDATRAITVESGSRSYDC